MFSGTTPNSTNSILDLFASAQKARTSVTTKDNSIEPTSTNTTSTTTNNAKASHDSLSSLKHLLTRTDSPSATTTTTTASIITPEGSTLLVQFKRAVPVKRPLLAAGRGQLLAYGASDRRIRVLNYVNGGRGLIDRPAGDSFVDVAWSANEAMLAVLSEDGEVVLGNIVAEGEELIFQPETSLSFPELGAAEGLAWAEGDPEHLAVWGKESNEVFFVTPSNNFKTLFISTQSPVKRVSLQSDACFVSNDSGVEVFSWTGSEFVDAGLVLSLPSEAEAWVFSGEMLNVFCVGLIGGELKIWAYTHTHWMEMSAMALNFPVDSVVFDPVSESLLLFQRGQPQLHLVSLKGGLARPKLIENVFEAPSGVLKVSLSPDTTDDVSITMFAYLTDCIIEHCLPVPELEDEQEMPVEMNFSTTDEESPVAVSLTVPSSTTTSSPLLDMEALRVMIKETVEECIKDSLAEIIHDALNRSVQSGFEQISRNLSVIVGELIKSVSAATNIASTNGTELTIPTMPQSPSIQDIRGLIEEGRSGEALVKAASVKDPRLLLEACRQLNDPFAALDREQLSQGNLVAIFKLLSLDIDEDTELKLDWLQEVLIQIDLEEAIGESSTLLKDIDTLLSDLKELVNDSLVDGALQKKMKTVMRLLRKFQIN